MTSDNECQNSVPYLDFDQFIQISVAVLIVIYSLPLIVNAAVVNQQDAELLINIVNLTFLISGLFSIVIRDYGLTLIFAVGMTAVTILTTADGGAALAGGIACLSWYLVYVFSSLKIMSTSSNSTKSTHLLTNVSVINA